MRTTVRIANMEYDVMPGHNYEVRLTARGFSARCPVCGKRHRGGIDRNPFAQLLVYVVSCGMNTFAIPPAQIDAARSPQSGE